MEKIREVDWPMVIAKKLQKKTMEKIPEISWPIVITDYKSPKKDTIAGRALENNMAILARYGSPQSWPTQHIDVFHIPQEYLDVAAVLVAGSPAGHGPEGGRSSQGHVEFKQDAFYSMCWQTPASVAVVMTFSASACPRLEWWTDSHDKTNRILMVSPAWFHSYRPRKGLAAELTTLADTADTMVALYLPAALVPSICWTDPGAEMGVPSKVNVAASIANWYRHTHAPRNTILTLAAYTSELECDLLDALLHDSSAVFEC